MDITMDTADPARATIPAQVQVIIPAPTMATVATIPAQEQE